MDLMAGLESLMARDLRELSLDCVASELQIPVEAARIDGTYPKQSAGCLSMSRMQTVDLSVTHRGGQWPKLGEKTPQSDAREVRYLRHDP